MSTAPTRVRRSGVTAPVTVRTEVDFGTAELVPDPRRHGGWTLLVDGVAQSYVDLSDPGRLVFEYVRRLAGVVDAAGPAGAPLRVLHLGGGGLTLPRYVAASRPGSFQRVVERDAALAALITRELPWSAGAGIDLTIGDAREAVESRTDRFDVVITDVYHAAQMPSRVASAEFVAGIVRLLRPEGLYAVNVADLPGLTLSRTHSATLRTAFGDVCLLADRRMLRGRRYGNVVLVAAAVAGTLPVRRLAAAAARDRPPGELAHGARLDDFIAGARALTDPPDRRQPPATLENIDN